MDSASTPDPVHRSRTTGGLLPQPSRNESAQPMSSSVSGRGMKTPGPTATSMLPIDATPMMCCNGIRFTRWATNSSNAAMTSGSTNGISPRRVRSTPSRWDANNSASVRGLGTPAASSCFAASISAKRSGSRLTGTACHARPTRGSPSSRRDGGQSWSASTRPRDAPLGPPCPMHREVRRAHRRAPRRGCAT